MKKPDIVSLKWVIGLMKSQADGAEAALVEYGTNPAQKQALLRCMWSVHQITSTLRALGMRKAEMLTLEMERSLNLLYKDKIAAERYNLTMGGLMQALKIIPAYLEHTENVRIDTGTGLEQFVNDLRRWAGEKPRPKALFFHINLPADAGITADAVPSADDEIRAGANVMLALYLEMAKQGLRKRKVAESMKTVARVARKMQLLFIGTPMERFWFTLIGLCEGIAGGLIVPDDCVAQIFKAGAFAIKHARENGAEIDDTTDFDAYQQQMLYYVAACKSRPVHITSIRTAFGIDENTISKASRALVHNDALEVALKGALGQLDIVVEFLSTNDLAKIAKQDPQDQDTSPVLAIEAAEIRLVAAGQMGHADALKKVQRQLKQFYAGTVGSSASHVERAVTTITGGIVGVKLDLEHKLQHGLGSSYAGKDFELRESVATATFKQMGLVENYLHQILRRKSLKSALDKKPTDAAGLLRLTMALQRYLNKTDKGHEELRQAIRDADGEQANIDSLFELARAYQNQLEVIPDREAIDKSLQLLREIGGALLFVGMDREGQVIEQCQQWLEAASNAGSVREDDAFRCFADAFAQIEMHLQRSLLDPLDDTSHMLALAEQRAAALADCIETLSPGRSVSTTPETLGDLESLEKSLVCDAQMPPEFREIFIEESVEIVAELDRLTKAWLQKPQSSELLCDIRRHFHTFKGNGRAVGANVLGELGWAAQDMLDRSLDGKQVPGESVRILVQEVVRALPALVDSYSRDEGPDLQTVRELTNACFAMSTVAAEEEAWEHPAIKKVIGAIGTVAQEPAALKILTH